MVAISGSKVLKNQFIVIRHPANTGKPNVAVLIIATAKIRKGIKVNFSIMRNLIQ